MGKWKEFFDKDTNPWIIKYETGLAKATENLPGWLGTALRWMWGTQVGSGLVMGVLSLLMTLPYQLCYDAGHWVASDVFWWLMVIFFIWPAFLILFYIFYGLIYKYLIRNVIMGEGR
jgi:hypothetical protein